MLRKNFPHRKAQRNIDAMTRQVRYNQLTLEEKIARAGKKQLAKGIK